MCEGRISACDPVARGDGMDDERDTCSRTECRVPTDDCETVGESCDHGRRRLSCNRAMPGRSLHDRINCRAVAVATAHVCSAADSPAYHPDKL